MVSPEIFALCSWNKNRVTINQDGKISGETNGMDLPEAEDIKKRWQEYTELYQKDLHNPDNHNGVITRLEPNILECESSGAKEASVQIKLVEVMEFQLNYFKS